jgi:hypothetical protein
VTIIEKFCGAQTERKGGAPNLSAAGRALRTPYNPLIPNLKPSQDSKILAQIRKWSRPLLIDSAPPTEFVVTSRKQTTEKILTGARTHIRNSAKQHLSSRPSPVFSSQNGSSKTPIADRKNPSFLASLPRVRLRRTKDLGWPSRFLPGSGQNIECDVTSRKQTPTKFLPGATTTCGRIESAQKNLSKSPAKFGRNVRRGRHSHCGLFRGPFGVAGEDAVHVAHFIDDEDAEGHAEQAGGDAENAVHARESLLRIFKRHGNGRGDQHHAGDSPHAEYQKIGDGPARVANGGEHQQRHRRRAGQSVNQSHRQRPHSLIQTELAENAVHPANGRGFGSVAMLFGIVAMRVAVNEIAMNVRMRMRVSMRMRGIGGGRERLSDPARESGKIQNSQQDQHQADGQLHGEA